MMPRSRPLAAAVVLLTVSFGCGGGGGSGGSPTAPDNPSNPSNPSGPSSSVTVNMTVQGDGYGVGENKFAPTQATVARNGTVTWSNATGIVHNVTFITPGGPGNVADHSAGSNPRAFSTMGTFNYHCTNHAGMDGSVVVQ